MDNRELIPAAADRSDRDRGVSLIEVVIAVVLLGMVAAATLTGLTATINASALDRDHANAHAWLQTAADMLYARDPISCNSGASYDSIKAAYQSTVQQTDNPEDWSQSNIVVTNLEFWNFQPDPANNGQFVEQWLPACDPVEASNLQKISLRVTAEDGRIVEEVEVIIGD